MFMNMTAKFNDSGAEALLLKNLPLDLDLDLFLEKTTNEKNMKIIHNKNNKDLNNSKYSDDFSNSNYNNVNCLFENNLRSIRTKCSSNTNSEKSLPKINFTDVSVNNIIHGKYNIYSHKNII